VLKWVMPMVAFLVLGSQSAGAADSKTDSTKSTRSPRGAMLRSLTLPGWGQFYNGRKIKGSVIAAAELGSVAAYFVRRDQIQRETPPGVTSPRNVYMFSTIILIFYGVIDAYVDAHLDAVDWLGSDLDTKADHSRRINPLIQMRFKVKF